jgi:hypothetical protein
MRQEDRAGDQPTEEQRAHQDQETGRPSDRCGVSKRLKNGSSVGGGLSRSWREL